MPMKKIIKIMIILKLTILFGIKRVHLFKKKNFNNKNEFPIDWRTVTHHTQLKWQKPIILENNHITQKKKIKSETDFKKIELAYEIKFFLNLEKPSTFLIETAGCVKSYIKIFVSC